MNIGVSALDVDSKCNWYVDNEQLSGLLQTFFFATSSSYPVPKKHSLQVALITERAAEKTGIDPAEAFRFGLFHDLGKWGLPEDLFDGHNFTRAEEYQRVQVHPQLGYFFLEPIDLRLALCAGTHHQGYGISDDHLPASWTETEVRKFKELRDMVSAADYADAATRGNTTLLDGSEKYGSSLVDILHRKHPSVPDIIDAVLQSWQDLFPEQAIIALKRTFK